jgi:hypothetical protein
MTMTILNALTGLVILFYGLYLLYYTPSFGSRFGGSIFPLARKHEEVWVEVHRYIAKPLIIVGSIISLATGIFFFLFDAVNPKYFLGIVFCGSMIILGLTRRHIQKTFDSDGRRRF